MYHFKIRGEISIYNLFDSFTPESLDTHLEQADGKDLLIDINSIGGCVNTGLSIYANLKRYAKDNNAKITTRADGFVASIATIIFLAGDKRIVNEFMQPFVHEPRFEWSDAKTADDFRKSYESLSKTRDVLADFYTKYTNLSKEEALTLMEEDTWIDSDTCLEIGFATEIEKLSTGEAKLVASLKNKLTKNKTNMKEAEIKASMWDRFMGLLSGKEQTDKPKENIVNQLTLKTSEQKEIVFEEVSTLEELEVGARATIDGELAAGTHLVVLNGENNELTFENGELTSIKVVEEEEDVETDVEAEVEAIVNAKLSEFTNSLKELKEENEKLKKQAAKADEFFNNLKGISSEFDQKIKNAKKPKEEVKTKNNPLIDALSKY